ncbi:MAG: sigma-70 family RNA polymerase sigma factor [Proteobacteria bacterium]|nr:sigma-70 family RNA polymerase sigma factor [Pseudomonadota bacterium]
MSHPLAISEPASPTIEALALRARDGEVECFDEIVRRIQPRLRGFLLTRANAADDVDDLVQETFIKALANLSRYDSRYRFSTWLFTIASNLAVSHHRAQRRSAGNVEVVAGPDEDPSATMADRDAGARLWYRARAVLKPAQYNVLWLRYGQDLTVKEIAKRTGQTAIHVRVLLYRARRRLAQEIV